MPDCYTISNIFFQVLQKNISNEVFLCGIPLDSVVRRHVGHGRDRSGGRRGEAVIGRLVGHDLAASFGDDHTGGDLPVDGDIPFGETPQDLARAVDRDHGLAITRGVSTAGESVLDRALLRFRFRLLLPTGDAALARFMSESLLLDHELGSGAEQKLGSARGDPNVVLPEKPGQVAGPVAVVGILVLRGRDDQADRGDLGLFKDPEYTQIGPDLDGRVRGCHHMDVQHRHLPAHKGLTL